MSTGPKFPADVPRSTAKIEEAAKAVRASLRFSRKGKVGAFDLLRGLRTLRVPAGVRSIPADYHVGDMAPGVLAKTHLVTDSHGRSTIEVMLSNSTLAQLEAGVPRALFSLAHELGHVWLHTNEIVRLSTIPHETAALLRGRYVALPSYKDVEWQANSFAGAFLMPAIALADLERRMQLDAKAVSEHFGVSNTCASIRLMTYRKYRRDLLAVK